MIKSTFTLFLSLFFSILIQGQETYFTLDPTLTPNGDIIIFSYDGDLWKINSNGGNATRLTGMQGDETRPSVSPDGKWVAFSASQYGNKDVYIIPLEGGEIRQLTFHDSADTVESWSWDSKKIFFTSSRENSFSSYEVSILGDTPRRLFHHYFNRVHNVAKHPKTGEIYFNESFESSGLVHRKRYKGDYNPDIKSYNLSTKKYTQHTSYRGMDLWPTFDKNGVLYFVSDEINGEFNLYTLKENKKTNLTQFTNAIKRPQVSANGQKVTFTKDYQLYIYDVASKSSKKVAVQLFNNNTLEKTQDFKVDGKITNFDISSDNKKMAFISRGILFVSDIKGKFIKQISINDPKERVVEVKWLADNKTLLFNQTVKGYLNLFTISADGKRQKKQITKDSRNNINIEINPKHTKATYISGRDELRVLDLTTLKSETVVKDEFWALYAPQPKFSPDGNYIVYNAIRNFENDIFVYNILSKKIINLTKTGVTENSPLWSYDGKYIYFSSNPTKPSYPYGLDEASIYRMALDKYEKPFRSDKFDKLFVESAEKEEEKDSKKEDTENVIKNLDININEDGLTDRIKRISPEFGHQGATDIISKDETSYILYISNHDKGKPQLWKTTIKPFEKNKTEKVTEIKGYTYQIASAKDQNYILIDGNINTLDIKSNKTEKIKIDFTFRKAFINEFEQMFHEAWANFGENFYDGDFHGEDWKQLKIEYSKFLPFINNRSELRLLLNDMLGELNTSHVRFNSNGDEEKAFYKTQSSSIGIIFSVKDPFLVERIITDGPADIKNKGITKGDRLTAVNGNKVDSKKNREFYFAQPSLDTEVMLTFSRNGKEFSTNIHPISSRNNRNLLYDEWVDSNQSYVNQKSNNRIAYVHMKNMGSNELTNFKKEMVSESYKKDALILDLRFNTGGNVHDEVLQFLSQKPYLQWKYRDGKLTSQPNFTPGAKPIILLINEQTLSDAEMTAAGFRELGLGKIIGTETYRWIIFTSGKRLVDGSYYRLPSWGCYTLDGKNLEKTGVSPDIYVKETFKDRIDGNQPQLDKAISEILQQLTAN
ncbi:S41 family peptidase [uncultured Aquimarina sp.]|uniref:S41 family peptidase n=1 Tax=uncultured Aquimarina sp. TaxID=575652 RepID=UPI00260813C3|nr:S41 family peptidase [uncultured Aquimarina sp.]